MNRQIKFRVWNKLREIFIIEGMSPYEIQQDSTRSLELPLLTSEDCVWQQYTGVNDDNGIEIYEGDLCYCESFVIHGPREKGVWECYWDQQHAGFLFHRYLMYTNNELTKKEVIGNIYENKELL